MTRACVSRETIVKKRILASLLLGQISLSAIAETIPTIVVTASRTAEPLEQTLPSTIVIDKETIELSQTNDVAELLRHHAGIEIGRNGGPGQVTSLFLRGTESNHTLVLIDGVAVNPGTIGGAAVQNISPALIERIEVVKGPSSTLYGSSAIGGVVNIITRRAETRGTQFSAGASGGGDDTWEQNLGIRHKDDRFRISLDVSHLSTDGLPTFKNTSVDRGHRNTGINFAADTTLGAIEVAISHWQAQGETEYWGMNPMTWVTGPMDQDFRNSATALTLKTTPLSNWDSQLQFSRITDRIDQNQSNDFTHTVRRSLDWQNNIQLNEQQRLLAGITIEREHTRSLSWGTAFDEHIDGYEAYAQDDIQLGKHRFTLGGRYIDHDEFGGTGIWNLAWGYDLTPATRLTASAGTAFRAPDSTDMYGYGGNPDLDPERSRSYELGLRQQLTEHQDITITAFYTRIKDLIEYYDPDGWLGPLPGQNVNLDRARIKGVEAIYGFQEGPWSLRVEAILQKPENPDNDRILPRRAKKSLHASLGYASSNWDARVDLLATGQRNDSAFNDNKMGGYGITNLLGRYHIDRHWQLEGRVENLFDKDYELASGYRTQDRIGFIGIRYQ
jgi:vitamin B12 transporter